MNTLQWCQWTCSFKAKNISSRARAETPGRLAESQRMDSDVITMSCLNKSATCFVSSGQCRWPIYPSGADGTLPCAWSWPCPALFLDWQRVVRSQPLSVRQALLLQTHGPRLILVPRFLRSPYAQPCRHLSAHASTHTHTQQMYMDTHAHWHERHILTSSCSTLDQQKESHMQSERGLWGQGAGLGKQPHCETCRSDKLKQAVYKLKGSLLMLLIYLWNLCFWLLKRGAGDEFKIIINVMKKLKTFIHNKQVICIF